MTSRGQWKPRQRLLAVESIFDALSDRGDANADAVRYCQAVDARPSARANIAATASEDGSAAATATCTATCVVSLSSMRRVLFPPAARNAEGGR